MGHRCSNLMSCMRAPARQAFASVLGSSGTTWLKAFPVPQPKEVSFHTVLAPITGRTRVCIPVACYRYGKIMSSAEPVQPASHKAADPNIPPERHLGYRVYLQTC